MKLSKVEFKKLLSSNLSERIYQRCRTCDRKKVESELSYIIQHPASQLPAKGLTWIEVINAIKKGIAAHDAYLENVAKERSCARLEVLKGNNQLTAF